MPRESPGSYTLSAAGRSRGRPSPCGESGGRLVVVRRAGRQQLLREPPGSGVRRSFALRLAFSPGPQWPPHGRPPHWFLQTRSTAAYRGACRGGPCEAADDAVVVRGRRQRVGQQHQQTPGPVDTCHQGGLVRLRHMGSVAGSNKVVSVNMMLRERWPMRANSADWSSCLE